MFPLLARSQATRRSNRRRSCRCDRRQEKTARRIAWGAVLSFRLRGVSACDDLGCRALSGDRADSQSSAPIAAHAAHTRSISIDSVWTSSRLSFHRRRHEKRLRAMSAAARSDISEIRKAWKEANLAPLWENVRAHRPAPLPEAAYLWSWDKIRPLISAAIDVASPEVVERRVLQLVPPTANHRDEQQTSRTLSANIQILLPGEKARPHRHTMNALRFVLEG